MAIVMIDLQ